jgi:sterol desaturase/sphingolipid hydroxylase (fatty acid hydroxylase superfamily)
VHHEVTAPFALTADYLHPIEFFWLVAGQLALHCSAGLDDCLPLSMNGCAMLAGMTINAHVTSLAVFFALGNTGGVLNHSGYHFPWVPRWLRDPDYHDYHHEFPNTNFSFFQVLDTLHGTNAPWKEKLRKAS